MARHVEGPWFRAGKGTWYATVAGRKVSLGVKGEENRREAVTAWHRLMAGGPTTTTPPHLQEENRGRKEEKEARPQETADTTVKAVVDAFLGDVKARVKPNTYGVYSYLLAKVSDAFGAVQAVKMQPGKLLAWLHGLKVSRSTRADVARVAATAFRWAEADGL